MLAAIRLLAGVDPLVHRGVLLAEKALAADRAAERFLARVGALVLGSRALEPEPLVAERASERQLPSFVGPAQKRAEAEKTKGGRGG